VVKDFNPYAPPQSEIHAAPAADAGVVADGKLVRTDLGGRLPDRCIRCNRPADGHRAERSIYWRPAWWRWSSWAGLLALFLMGITAPMFMIIFWIGVLGAVVVDFLLRRKFVVEYGLCGSHRRLRTGVMASFVMSWAALIGFAGATWIGFRAPQYWWFWALVLVMLALSVVASLLYRIRIARLTDDHMWLQGTGRRFHQALPSATT